MAKQNSGRTVTSENGTLRVGKSNRELNAVNRAKDSQQSGLLPTTSKATICIVL